MKLGSIMILTPDLAEADRFYRDVLGLSPVERTSNQLVYALAGIEFRIFRCANPAEAQTHAATAATICVFEVASIDAEMIRMRNSGVVFIHEAPAHNSDSGFRYAAFHAPGGNVHEIMERDAAL